MDKICKNCSCYEVCIWANPYKTEDCKIGWQPILVRCKDCQYWKDSWVAPDGKQSHGYCHLEDADDVIVGRWDDDFCSYGERKDHETD